MISLGLGLWSSTILSRLGFSPSALFANGEPGVWFDPSPTTTFTDTAGTTPATVGSAVALMLDKSKGLALGPELVTNGTFDTDTSGWVAGSGMTLSAVDGDLRIQRGASVNQNNYTSITTVVGRSYKIQWSYKGRSAGSNHYTDFRIGSTIGGVDNYRALDSAASEFAQGQQTALFSATATTSYITIVLRDGVSGDFIEVDNISVKELPGFHATQPTLAARPILARVPARGRANLLTRTEEFDNAVWTKSGGGDGTTPTVTPGFEAPDLTNTAWRLQGSRASTGSTNFSLLQQALVTTNGVGSIWVKSNTGVTQNIYFRLSLDNVVAVTNEWQRVSVTNASVSFFSIGLRSASDLTCDILIWHPQLEQSSTASAYQKVTSTFDVTEAGQADNYYLFHGGSADPRWMQTPSIDFTGTDKMSVFAGVRLLVPRSNNSPMVQIGDSVVSATDALIVFRSGDGSLDSTRFSAAGLNVSQSARVVQAYPSSSVFSGLFDGAATGVSEIDYRIDGISVSNGSTTDSGITSIGSQLVFIGANNLGGLVLNGHLYSLIVRGALTDLPTIERTERYVASKTAGVSL
jgi:hypothetical protein